MKAIDTLSDLELEQIAAAKDSSLAIPALLEMRKRNDRRTLWWVGVPAWLAAVIAVLTLLDLTGILKLHMDKDVKSPINAGNIITNTAAKK